MTDVDARTIDQQFRDDFAELARKVDATRTQFSNPAHVEKHCTEFEKQWTEKLDTAGLQHVKDDMKTAVDAIRTEEKPDLTFTIEMRPQFKLTAEATRRIAHSKINDREF